MNRDTSDKTFPHHWDCVYTEEKGHPRNQYECTVRDGTRRVPDGSIVARDHIRGGGVALGVHDLNTRKVTPYIIVETQERT